MTGAPIRVTLADATPPGTPDHMALLVATATLQVAALDIRSRRCTDCGAPYLVVMDEDGGAFTATPTCPPPCPGHVPRSEDPETKEPKWH